MLKNSTQRYGLVAMLLHWLMALAVFGMFGLGLYMVELTYYDAWYKGSLEWHKSVGILLFFTYCFRLLWKLFTPQPEHFAAPLWQMRLAKTVHVLLYVLLLSIFVSGYLISTADGRAIDVFGWFSVPATLSGIDGQEDIAGDVHEILVWICILLAGLHAAAALKHFFIDKDKLLQRMLP